MRRRDFQRVLAGVAGALLLPVRLRAAQRPVQRVNAERLTRLMREQAQFGRTAAGGVERLAYTDADLACRAWVMDRMREAGLAVRVDTAGNIIGRREGGEPSRPPLVIGSHTDSVPDGGAFDGQVGSFGALETAWTLHDRNARLRHALEVVIFQNEEGGLYGSQAMAGTLTADDLAQRSRSGKTIAEGISILGGDPDRLDAAARRRGDIAAYVELHIEQGAILDATDIDIGVVEGIVGIEQWTVTVEGFANHAGTTPMDQRRDALVAAAKFVQAVNEIIRGEPGRQVGTVGQIAAHPGAPNVIPGRVVLSLEIRDLDGDKIWRLYERIRARGMEIGRLTDTAFTFTDRRLDIVPEPTDPGIRATITRAATELGLTHQPMPSGAGHDAQSLAPLAPIGMIFVPSVGGISHSPREFTHPGDVVNGANVLLNTVVALDREM